MSTELPPGVKLIMPDGSSEGGQLSDSEWTGDSQVEPVDQEAALRRIAKARVNGGSKRSRRTS